MDTFFAQKHQVAFLKVQPTPHHIYLKNKCCFHKNTLAFYKELWAEWKFVVLGH